MQTASQGVIGLVKCPLWNMNQHDTSK